MRCALTIHIRGVGEVRATIFTVRKIIMIVLDDLILIFAVTILQVTRSDYAALEILRVLWLTLSELKQVLILVCHEEHLRAGPTHSLTIHEAGGVRLVPRANSFLLN